MVVSYNAVKQVKNQNKISVCIGLPNSLKQFFTSSDYLFLASLASDSITLRMKKGGLNWLLTHFLHQKVTKVGGITRTECIWLPLG